MKVLILDTATDYLFVRFYDDQEESKVFYAKDMISHNNHSENLLKVIEEGLNENKIELASFDRIIIGQGPGSYTGLRIAMVVGKMASYTLDIPLYIISSLSLLGSGYYKEEGTFAVITKAKKDYSYMKIFSSKNNTIKVLEDDMFIANDEAEKMILSYNAQKIEEYKLDVEEIISEAKLVDNVHELVPNYLRKANS